MSKHWCSTRLDWRLGCDPIWHTFLNQKKVWSKMSNSTSMLSSLPSTASLLHKQSVDRLQHKIRSTSCAAHQFNDQKHVLQFDMSMERDGNRNISSDRRSFALGIGTVLLSSAYTKNALAKRKPPAPEEEKKPKENPNVGGVIAKVQASKRRKEAMKAAMEKLKEQATSKRGNKD